MYLVHLDSAKGPPFSSCVQVRLAFQIGVTKMKSAITYHKQVATIRISFEKKGPVPLQEIVEV